MATVDVRDMKGATAGKAELSDAVFAVEPNTFAMHQVVRSQLAGARAGTHQTKTRGFVSGGGRKPWRQKGTGRARQGSIRSPQWRGGGVVFGPHPRSYAFKVPNKVVKLAMRSALSAKFAEEVLHVVDKFDFEKPSTKDAVAMIKALGLEGKRITVVLPNDAENAYLSFRNVDRVRVIVASEANTYDLIDNAALLFSAESLNWVEEVLS